MRSSSASAASALRRRLALIERLGLLLDRRLRFARRPADCSSAALATCSAPFCASRAARSASSAAVSMSWLPSAMLAHVGAHGLQRLRPRSVPAWLRATAVRRRSSPRAPTSRTSVWIVFGQASAPPARSSPSLGQRPHLVGHHREAAAVIAGARRLDRGVQRQQIGLIGDAADRAG